MMLIVKLSKGNQNIGIDCWKDSRQLGKTSQEYPETCKNITLKNSRISPDREIGFFDGFFSYLVVYLSGYFV